MVGMADETPEAKPPEKLTLRTVQWDDQEKRAMRAEAQRQAHREGEKKRADLEMKVRVTEALTGRLPRDGMAPVFFAAARRIAMDLLLGNIQVRNGTEAGAAINALISAGRLEAGAAEDPGVGDITKTPASPQEAQARLQLLHAEVAKRRGEASGE